MSGPTQRRLDVIGGEEDSKRGEVGRTLEPDVLDSNPNSAAKGLSPSSGSPAVR